MHTLRSVAGGRLDELDTLEWGVIADSVPSVGFGIWIVGLFVACLSLVAYPVVVRRAAGSAGRARRRGYQASAPKSIPSVELEVALRFLDAELSTIRASVREFCPRQGSRAECCLADAAVARV